MKFLVIVDASEAMDGYEEDELPTVQEHVYEINELLRSGYYSVDKIEVVE